MYVASSRKSSNAGLQSTVSTTFQPIPKNHFLLRALLSEPEESPQKGTQWCLKKTETRENAHFFDAPHKNQFRYFSFMLVNDKLTSALQ
ncbi:hypothetical protein A8L51_20605 [Pantoea stewartii]|nr:hypothetical protein [Pantoea stewartii]